MPSAFCVASVCLNRYYVCVYMTVLMLKVHRSFVRRYVLKAIVQMTQRQDGSSSGTNFCLLSTAGGSRSVMNVLAMS